MDENYFFLLFIFSFSFFSIFFPFFFAVLSAKALCVSDQGRPN